MATVTVPGSGTRVYAATPQPAFPNPYANPYMNPYANPYANPYLNPQQTLATSILGRVTTGQMIDLVAQIFAALMPLPGAPSATADANTDVGNLIMLCRARHNMIYADRRIMPRSSRFSTVGHVISAA
jgi:hypothetical protein